MLPLTVSISTTFSKMFATLMQINWVAKLLLLLVSFFSPTLPFAVLSIIFILADLGTGIWAAKKRMEKITSKGIRTTIGKCITYLLAIELMFLFEKIILETDIFKLVNIITGIILLAEFKSITENLSSATGNKVFTNIYNVVNNIFRKKNEIDDSPSEQK